MHVHARGWPGRRAPKQPHHGHAGQAGPVQRGVGGVHSGHRGRQHRVQHGDGDVERGRRGGQVGWRRRRREGCGAASGGGGRHLVCVVLHTLLSLPSGWPARGRGSTNARPKRHGTHSLAHLPPSPLFLPPPNAMSVRCKQTHPVPLHAHLAHTRARAPRRGGWAVTARCVIAGEGGETKPEVPLTAPDSIAFAPPPKTRPHHAPSSP